MCVSLLKTALRLARQQSSYHSDNYSAHGIRYLLLMLDMIVQLSPLSRPVRVCVCVLILISCATPALDRLWIDGVVPFGLIIPTLQSFMFPFPSLPRLLYSSLAIDAHVLVRWSGFSAHCLLRVLCCVVTAM